MNKHIQLVEKWLDDKDSVTQEELEQNKKEAYAAYYAAFAANAAYTAYYADTDAAADTADAAYWVKGYHQLTGEKK
tara:strand:- start:2055 stop:2282 length:228 start_codon:yes stop_codon:yes gene_type:complete